MFQLWTLGIIINLFLFYSIFDIYFKSPIVPVHRRHRLDKDVPAPFKRVVFFVADGLRADTFYDNPHRRPYLTNVMKRDSCVWGISDTRVPTESRPGHVALFAGFYEDPSAVFTGWKENSVEFDTIFNQSSASVGLGSGDIVSMFVKGAAGSKMFAASYPRSWQDFSASSNLTRLDSWVFDYLSGMVNNRTLPKIAETVVFLNLLGIDTTGHAVKPGSESYKSALHFVDDLVRQTELMLDEYYGDNKTLYVLTADHGMTDWGSHGDGSKEETETPFIIWGAGIQKTSELLRLKQADFAALLAGSLGIGYPSNSIGKFPANFWIDHKFAFEALKANFYQLFDLMQTKMILVKSNRNLPMVNFAKEELIQDKLRISYKFAENSNFGMAINAVNEAMEFSLEGIVYYERYDEQLLILFSVCVTVSWILLVGCIIILMNSSYDQMRRVRIFILQYVLFALLIGILIIKVIIGWSIWRVLYGFFPSYIILLLVNLGGINFTSNAAFQDRNVLVRIARNPRLNSLFLLLVFAAFGVTILVNSFDQRGVLSLGLFLNAIWCVRAKRVSSWQRTLFFVAVALLAVFPLMPVIGKERNPLFITLGPVLSVVLVGVLLYIRRKKPSYDIGVFWAQMVLLGAVSMLCHFPEFTLTRVISWLSVMQSYFLPVLVSAETITGRLISIFLAIASPFSLISFSYEALFFPSLFLVLFMLIKIEMSEENLEDSWADFLSMSVESTDRRKLWERVDLHQAVRRAWLHLFFVMLSFFGTGNIASINSFDPSSTRCFVSVFNPWIMMLVLIEKILGPFLLVSCFFRRLLWSKPQVERSFLIVLLLCQGMTLHTFFKVKNVGSWLDIGTSISHHVIVSATTLCLFLLHFIANFIMSYEPWPSSTMLKFSIPYCRNLESQKSFKMY